MIITSMTLAANAQNSVQNNTQDQAPFSGTSLLLASHTINDEAKLICCTWSQENESWQDSIKLSALTKRYNLAGLTVEFIAADQLDARNSEQQLLLAAVAQMQQYLQGDRQTFDLPLDISLGTPFQQGVWQALLDINHGETISYATLAERVDNPKGYRAAANANGKNPLSIIIPCHRVIASDGKLGGYTGGLDKKEYLLALEGSKYKV